MGKQNCMELLDVFGELHSEKATIYMCKLPFFHLASLILAITRASMSSPLDIASYSFMLGSFAFSICTGLLLLLRSLFGGSPFISR